MNLHHLLPSCLIVVAACSSTRVSPDPCGPTMDQKSVQETFAPIIDYLDLKPGQSFADVGASGGGLTIMMSSLMTNNAVYVQDIDTRCLNEKQVATLVTYYSKQSKRDLQKINSYHTVIGTVHHTNLPAGGIDRIYSNATFHQFSDVDGILDDFYHVLKPSGTISIRDSFSDKAETEYCSDKKCAMPLTKTDVFLAAMRKHNFVLIKSKEFFGYPIYVFSKSLTEN